MAKLTKLEREIAKIDEEIAVLQAVRVRLVAAQTHSPKRKSSARPKPVAVAANE
jgi:hypothetical protein